MSIKEYLNTFSVNKLITLVGPLCESVTDINEPTIFVDGGTSARKTVEGISVGDGDSYQGKLDVTLEPEKDISDLAFALRNIPEGFSEIILLGFLGGRRDHEFFNLGETHQFLKSRRTQTRVCFDEIKILGYSPGHWQFQRNGGFSIAVIEPATLMLKGECKYPCSGFTQFQPLSSLGLSNLGFGTIFMECDGPVFVLFEALD